MKPKFIITGIILVFLGISLFTYYDLRLRPEREARELMTEAAMIYERGDKVSINQAIDIYTKVLVKYPKSKYIPEAYYLIGRCYEAIGLNRLAYLKYTYLLKNKPRFFTEELRKETMIRMAHINLLKQYSEEGIHQLYGLLHDNYNREFRSRVYTELGHTFLKLGEYRRSKRMFDIALSEYGGNEEAMVGKARALKRLGQDSDAFDMYDDFLKYYGAVSQYTRDVRDAYRHEAYRSGLASFKRGDYQSAVSFFNRVMKNFRDDRLAENAMYWAGESYFALRRFDTAIGYFNRVLDNSFTHKDQDAQIKKGYAYFMSKRFDLAAREFQTYLRNYPQGRYAATAREWKSMSTKELLYRIEGRKTEGDSEDEMIEREDIRDKKIDRTQEGDEEVAGEYGDDAERIELENVAEL